MSQPYVGEIRIFGFNFAPANWAICAGQLMDISQNNTLFQIVGTTYGGNGQTTFGLPQMQDMTVVGAGQGNGLRNWPLGAGFGEAGHTLLINEVPMHNHTARDGQIVPLSEQTPAPTATSYPGSGSSTRIHLFAQTANSSLAGATIGAAGSSLPHPNIQPVLAVNWCISLFGVFPSQN